MGDVLEFGEFRLDLRRMGVWKHDHPVPLEPKALDVLTHLVANRDRLVSKDELMDVVWKDTFVTPNALTRAVAQIRKSLDDDVHEPRVIETVAKRGYRFVAAVTVRTNIDGQNVDENSHREVTDSARRPRWLPVAGVVGLVLLLAFSVTPGRTTGAVVPGPVEITQLTAYGDVIDAAVAPDGKSIAYVRSSQGRQSLWIRQLRGTNPIELVPAADVSYYGLAFAPDSASIFYVVRGPEPLAFPTGMLFRIAALGGAPRRLGTPFDRQPSVSPDGRHLASLRSSFPTATESALLVTDADGTGARTLLVAREPESLAPGFFIAPAWSPGGDRIAAAIRRGNSAQLAIVDVATGAVRRLESTFTNASFATWLHDGSGIAFVAANKSDPGLEFGSRIWLQPLPAGQPRPLTSGIVEYRNVTATADSAALVSVGSLQNGSLWRIPLDQSGPLMKIPAMKDDGGAGVAWIDAETMAFTSLDGGGPQVWTMALDGSARRQLTTDGWNAWPRASRDGTTIYFISTRNGQSGLWRMNHDGTAQHRLAPTPEARELALSADEQSLTFTGLSDDRVDSTWRVSVAGGQAALLVKGLTRAAGSPDGKWIAGIWQERPDANPVLAVFGALGGAPLKTFSNSHATVNGGVWWSKDGALYFTGADRMNVWRQPLDGDPPHRASSFADAMLYRGDVSPDGKTLLAFRGNPMRDAFLITGFR